MNVLFLATSSNNVWTVMNSLKACGLVGFQEFHYDSKFLQARDMIVKKAQDMGDAVTLGDIQRGDFSKLPQLQRAAVSCDAEMLIAAKVFRPDVIFYISAWEGAFVPANETLGELNQIAPLVHVCFDGADGPWWGPMLEFEKAGIFSLTWTIDGAHIWPGGRDWQKEPQRAFKFHEAPQFFDTKNTIKGVTTLTPIDPHILGGRNLPMTFMDRPIAVGYAGNGGGLIRQPLIAALDEDVPQFMNRGYSDTAASYRDYMYFLENSKVTLSTPWTGSGTACHIKGKLVEGGLAGAAVMERDNPVTRAWFHPRFEFWPYETIEDCVEQAKYLVSKPRLCEDIAAALHHRVVTEYSARAIWETVFAALGMDFDVKEAA